MIDWRRVLGCGLSLLLLMLLWLALWWLAQWLML